eukprot:scaffold1437_cov353-Prasinococcus_capsulatus_cf.AAC.7
MPSPPATGSAPWGEGAGAYLGEAGPRRGGPRRRAGTGGPPPRPPGAGCVRPRHPDPAGGATPTTRVRELQRGVQRTTRARHVRLPRRPEARPAMPPPRPARGSSRTMAAADGMQGGGWNGCYGCT